jgi:hypothetical protein
MEICYLIFLGGANPALDASSIVLKQISGLVLLYQEEYFVWKILLRSEMFPFMGWLSGQFIVWGMGGAGGAKPCAHPASKISSAAIRICFTFFIIVPLPPLGRSGCGTFWTFAITIIWPLFQTGVQSAMTAIVFSRIRLFFRVFSCWHWCVDRCDWFDSYRHFSSSIF